MRMDTKPRPPDPRPEGKAAAAVLAVECVAGGSRAAEWNLDMLQTGDIVEEIAVQGSAAAGAPFRNGRKEVQKLLRAAYKRNDTSVSVRVRRGTAEFVELHACIVPDEAAGRKQYLLRSIHDPNYAVTFVDRTEGECARMQGSRSSRVACALSRAQLQDGYVSYPWEKKMREFLPVPNSSSFLSLLVLPRAADPSATRYNALEDTQARANAWLNSSQASGVPIVFMNVQCEALLTKISGETASSTVNAGSLSDLSNIGNTSLYGFEDYHGVDIGVVRAVRLWYTPLAGEFPVEIQLLEGDSRLGFSVGRTEEGFIFVSSVGEDDGGGEHQLPSTRSGLRGLYREAKKASKLLVISRVSGEKVLPWMVSPSGAIRCFDTVSISQKLSLHRHALQPILLHVLLWERRAAPAGGGSRGSDHVATPPTTAPPPRVPAAEREPDDAELPPPAEVTRSLARDAAGEASFRFHGISLPSSWL